MNVSLSGPRRLFPEAPMFAVGYSLGGLILTKYLAEADMGMHGVYSPPSSTGQEGGQRQGSSGLTAAAVVSSPVCMYNSSANLLRPWTLAYLYNLAIAFKLRCGISGMVLNISRTLVARARPCLMPYIIHPRGCSLCY